MLSAIAVSSLGEPSPGFIRKLGSSPCSKGLPSRLKHDPTEGVANSASWLWDGVAMWCFCDCQALSAWQIPELASGFVQGNCSPLAKVGDNCRGLGLAGSLHY